MLASEGRNEQALGRSPVGADGGGFYPKFLVRRPIGFFAAKASPLGCGRVGFTELVTFDVNNATH